MIEEIDIWDVDDVLINIRDSLCAALNKMTGKNIHWTDWYSYDLHEEFYNISLAAFFSKATDGKAIENSVSEVDKLHGFINRSRKNIIVTNRGWHPQAHHYTYKELSSFVSCTSDYHYLVPFISVPKAQYIFEKFILPFGHRVKNVFEDSPSFCSGMIAYLQSDPEAFSPDFKIKLVDRPWNQGIVHERIERLFL